MKNMILRLFSWKEVQEGQTLVEYALIIVLVAIAIIGLLTTLGTDIGAVFTRISGNLAE
jgi:pilus assembly protein Flp/PilA